MFCRNCGKEVTDGAKFCRNCGAAIGSQLTPAAEPPKPPPPAAQQKIPAVEQTKNPGGSSMENGSKPERDVRTKSLSKPFMIGALALVLVLIIGFVAVPKLLGGGSEPDSHSGEKFDANYGDLAETDAEEPYSQYAGTWAAADIGWVYGGQILDIAVSGDNMTVEFSEIQSAPASRVASVTQTIPVSEIQNGVATASFDNDGWGHSGTIGLTFTEEAIICEIKNIIESPENQYAQWGVMEGKFLLVRNSAAHASMEYELEEYYQMFPDENDGQDVGNTDWIDKIPYVPGYADLFYFEDSGVQAHLRPHTVEAGSVVDFIGLSDAAQVSYSTADINGGTVIFGQGPDRIVSYAEVWEGDLGPASDYYSIVVEQEPVIGKREDGYCFLLYRRDYDNGDTISYCYEMYVVQQTDSPNYTDWPFKAYVYVNDPQYCDCLNGTEDLEIISIPGQSMQ